MELQSALQDKRYLFWTLQSVGWSGWAMSHYVGTLVWNAPPPNYPLYLLVVACVGMLFSLGLRLVYRHMWEMAIFRRIVAVLLASYVAGVGWMVCRSSIFPLLVEKEPKPMKGEEEMFSFLFHAGSAFWVMLVWSGLYFGIKYYMELQEEKQHGLKAMSMAHEAQLKMLRYQLNPHFLFNTLNAISTLILDQDTKLANLMVTRLSRFLRYSLDNDPMLKVSVTQEIEALKLYLDIEKVRFDDRLRLHFDIEPAAESALMPSLLLQPLVENAIKYAIAHSVNGGAIEIRARVFGGDLLLVIADDGPGLDLRNGRLPNNGGGVGLANCRERLKEIYKNDQSFRLSTTDPHGLTISMRLPLEREIIE
ncbi:MAG: histidine kinase [Halieaceae bacterium]|nr:histidine kinase [Halieaceae bacterium]